MEPGNKDLTLFVLACNSLRSAQKAAEGFTSDARVYNLRCAQTERDDRLKKLVEWVEQKAREELNK